MDEKNMPVFPGWETVRLIGKGSFGGVYEIRRDLFGNVEEAAMKVLHIPQSDGDVEELQAIGYDEASITAHFQEHLQALIKEYSLMAELKSHPNVVKCDDIKYVQSSEGFGWDVFIRMELLTPLMKALDKVSTPQQIAKMGADICSVLEECEKCGLIHRDIKPQNIFISKYGDFKLGDFGIAKNISSTTGGTVAGTLNYMAPEVYSNRPYGHRADQYSLGLVMYWFLNGKRGPFLPLSSTVPKKSEADEAFARRMKGDQVPAPENGSEELKAVVRKACAFAPEDRFMGAKEMKDALLACPEFKEEAAFNPAPAEEVSYDATYGIFGTKTKPEPVKPEPVKPTPVKPEPVKSEPTPVKPEPVKREPVKPEPVKPTPAPAKEHSKGKLSGHTGAIFEKYYAEKDPKARLLQEKPLLLKSVIAHLVAWIGMVTFFILTLELRFSNEVLSGILSFGVFCPLYALPFSGYNRAAIISMRESKNIYDCVEKMTALLKKRRIDGMIIRGIITAACLGSTIAESSNAGIEDVLGILFCAASIVFVMLYYSIKIKKCKFK